jgi:hypothetical protein
MANEASHHVKEWCSGKLSYFLGFEDATLTDYILTFKTRKELVGYLNELLGNDAREACQTFIQQLCEKLNLDQEQPHEIPLASNPLPTRKDEAKKSQRSTKHITLASYRPCNCQAREHPLLTNCVQCGRIACIMEGDTCSFCHTYLFADDIHADQKKKRGRRTAQ